MFLETGNVDCFWIESPTFSFNILCPHVPGFITDSSKNFCWHNFYFI